MNRNFILLLLIFSIFPQASATIWDDAKEFAETHKKKIVIGAAIVVAAAIGFGCGVGGKIAYDRYFKKNVAQGTQTVRDVIGSVTSSVQGSASKITSVAPMGQSPDMNPVQVSLVANNNMEGVRGFPEAFIAQMNEKYANVRVLLSTPSQITLGNSKGLIFLSREENRPRDSIMRLAKTFDESPIHIRTLVPKVLILVNGGRPHLEGDQVCCEEIGDLQEAGAVFSKVFHIAGLREGATWLLPTDLRYNQKQLKAMLDGIAQEFTKK